MRQGGVLAIDGESIRYKLPADCEPLLPELAAHKPELLVLLRAQGGRIATFPHCPGCASYALFRDGNSGVYECLSCGLANIEESLARRLVCALVLAAEKEDQR